MTLTWDRLHRAMFQLADLWVDSTDATDYVKFHAAEIPLSDHADSL